MTAQIEHLGVSDPLAFMPVARRFVRYLLTLTVPVSAMAFSLSGPHLWYWALAFGPILVLHEVLHEVLDARAKPGRDAPVDPFFVRTVPAQLRSATAELQARKLGPFAEVTT